VLLLLVMAGGFLIHPVHGGGRGQHGGIVHGVLLLVVAGRCFGLHDLVSASGRRRIAAVDVHGLDSLRRRRRCRLQLRLFVHWLLLLLLMLLRARPVARAALQLLVRLWLVVLLLLRLLLEDRTAEGDMGRPKGRAAGLRCVGVRRRRSRPAPTAAARGHQGLVLLMLVLNERLVLLMVGHGGFLRGKRYEVVVVLHRLLLRLLRLLWRLVMVVLLLRLLVVLDGGGRGLTGRRRHARQRCSAGGCR
jgi:hypothetical protein